MALRDPRVDLSGYNLDLIICVLEFYIAGTECLSSNILLWPITHFQIISTPPARETRDLASRPLSGSSWRLVAWGLNLWSQWHHPPMLWGWSLLSLHSSRCARPQCHLPAMFNLTLKYSTIKGGHPSPAPHTGKDWLWTCATYDL